MEKKWVVAEKFSEDIVSQLLYNRGLKDKNSIANFFNPPTPEVIVAQYPNYLEKISTSQMEKALNLIKNAIDGGRPIVIHGDYDVDGICGTAILYQAFKSLGANVTPFIPDRFKHGYGLSKKSIDHISDSLNPILITTDCGINAVEEVKYAKSKGFDIIITDHHAKRGNSPAQRDITPSLPKADAFVWTDELAGAGVAWLLSQILLQQTRTAAAVPVCRGLELVALATIADVQPLTGVNRVLVKYGLEELNSTRRPSTSSGRPRAESRGRVGLKELIKVAGLEEKELGPYEVGWMLGPRLNASGRLGNASDSLKLLLTDDPIEAQEISAKLNRINQERQQLTQQTVDEARRQANPSDAVIVVYNKSWHEGIVGLVAGRLKEEFYRPTVIIAGGEKISKGSARSVNGFNIVEALRECEEFLVSVGGHPMAAGLTIETEKIPPFKEKLLSIAATRLSEETLTPTLKIDAETPLGNLSWDLLENLKKFEPFGMGNPKPTFLTKSVRVLDIRTVGNNGKHLKLQLRDMDDTTGRPLQHWPCIGFGLGEWEAELRSGDLVDIVYNLEENHWNGQTTLQLKLKDLMKSES